MKKEFYEVEVEGYKLQAPFDYAGFEACRKLVADYGKQGVNYTIKYRYKYIKEVK